MSGLIPNSEYLCPLLLKMLGKAGFFNRFIAIILLYEA